MCKGAIRGSQHCRTLLMGHGFLCVPQQRLLRKACPGQTLFWRNEDGAAPKAPLPLVNSRQAERCYSKNLLCTPSAQCCNDEFRYLKAWPKESIHFFHSHPHADLGSVTAKVGLLKKKQLKSFQWHQASELPRKREGKRWLLLVALAPLKRFRCPPPAACGLLAAAWLLLQPGWQAAPTRGQQGARTRAGWQHAGIKSLCPNNAHESYT